LILVLCFPASLSVSLFSCIDTDAWTAMFYELTGLDPATTTVQARPSGTNANCAKNAIRGAEVVADSMIVVVESSAISAQVISQTV
jgi:hypothetical protein